MKNTWHRHLMALLLALCAGLPVALEAQGRNQFLEEGKRLIARGKPAKAAEELQQALEFPELPLVQRLAILGYLGAAHYLAGHETEATEAWEARAHLDPDGDLPDELSGDVRSAYVQVRAGVVVIEHLPPPGALAGREIEIRVNLRDRYAATQDLIVYHRRAGKKRYQAAQLTRDDIGWHVKLRLPPLVGAATSYEYEYYLVAQSEEGEILHSTGTETAPLSVRVVAPAGHGGPITATLPDVDGGNSGGDRAGGKKPGTGLVIVRRDPPPDDGADSGGKAGDTGSLGGATRSSDGLGPDDAVVAGARGRDRDDEVIEAVAIDVELPDKDRPHRRGFLGGKRTGSAKWVWITLGVVAAVAGGTVAIVAASGGDKIPQTDLGVIRYPLTSSGGGSGR